MSVKSFLKNHLWVPILSGVVLMIILLVLFLYIRRRCRRRRDSYSPLIDSECSRSNQDVKSPYKKRVEAAVEAASLECQYYCRCTLQLEFSRTLPYMGSRVSKHWFIVTNQEENTEQLLLLTPRSPNCVIHFDEQTRQALKELLSSSMMQHPYLLPIKHIDFIRERQRTVVVEPFCKTGSLKDIIYQRDPASSWDAKYRQTGRGLSLSEIATYGRHVLEAMIFLIKRGFPHGYYVHSGNVIIDKDVARLTGYEGALLGYTSRHFPLIKPMVSGKEKHAIDAVAFGHLIYEMAMGAELRTEAPHFDYLENRCHESVVQILKFIFVQCETGEAPSLENIAKLYFFAQVPVHPNGINNEMKFSQPARDLLKTIRRGRKRRLPNTKTKDFSNAATVSTMSSSIASSMTASSIVSSICVGGENRPIT